MRMTIEQMARAMNAMGEFESVRDLQIGKIRTDSRLVEAGDVFFAIVGRNMDGHTFAVDAAGRGAAAVVVHQIIPGLDTGACPVLLVRDTLQALGCLAARWRRQTRASVVGITGSAGKTTTKEILATILEQIAPTGKNYKNFNNRLGLALSILEFNGLERFWVLELGINETGEMDDLGAMLQPDLGVILNAGPCHLEGLGSVRGVCVAKASLLAHLPAHGQALVNQDYPELFQAASAVKSLPTPFSALDASAPISCLYQGLGPDGRGRYLLRLSGREIMLDTAFSGRAMAENLAAAAGAAFLLGLPLEAIRDGIAASAPIDGRFHIRGQGRRTLIDDSYNANPLSMRLALERARELAGARPLVLVLGEMLELGPAREDEHRRLAALASSVSCAALFFHGSSWSAVQDGYRGPQGTLHQLQCPSDLVRAMQSGLVPADAVVLFKGSRGSRMDRFLQAMGGQA